MRKSVLVSLLCVVFSLASPARGDCVAEDAAGPGAVCIALNKGGFRLSDAKMDEVSRAVQQAPLLLDQAARLRALASSQEQRAVAAERAVEARRAQAAEALAAAEKAVRVADQFRADLLAEQARAGAWYRSPWFWLPVGVALGAGGVATLVAAVR